MSIAVVSTAVVSAAVVSAAMVSIAVVSIAVVSIAVVSTAVVSIAMESIAAVSTAVAARLEWRAHCAWPLYANSMRSQSMHSHAYCVQPDALWGLCGDCVGTVWGPAELELGWVVRAVVIVVAVAVAVAVAAAVAATPSPRAARKRPPSRALFPSRVERVAVL